MSLHALLLVDREHLRHQYAQLGRLSVALTTSGCTVQAVTPSPPFGDDHPADRPIGIGTPIQMPDHVAPWLRQARIDRLRDPIDRHRRFLDRNFRSVDQISDRSIVIETLMLEAMNMI